MTALISRKSVKREPPTQEDRRADEQRIRDSLGLRSIDIPLAVLQGLKQKGRVYEKKLTCIVGALGNGYKLIDMARDVSYSIAIDLGTTNLAGILYDNVGQKQVLERRVENPQIAFGADILTRMHHAMKDGSGALYASLSYGIDQLVSALCRDAGVGSHDIHGMVIAGNTVMTHFFLGLDISTIPVEPFVPVVRKPGFFRASDLKLPIHPEASVYLFPNAGSYVGGDIISGIVASKMFDSDDLAVLIDVGTNAEIVIGNKDWMLVGAGAAGPALEEGISMIGKRAERGTIYDVVIDEGLVSCKTFGNASPEGICGSGMVSLIYEMHRAGIIGQDGILDPDNEKVNVVNGEHAFTFSCSGDGTLSIRQSEIDNFMRSKAAMVTLLLVLLRSVGLGFRDVRTEENKEQGYHSGL